MGVDDRGKRQVDPVEVGVPRGVGAAWGAAGLLAATRRLRREAFAD